MSWPPKEHTFTEPRDLNQAALEEIQVPWKAYTTSTPSLRQLMNETYRIIKSHRGPDLIVGLDADDYEPHQRSLTKEK